jgi:hypothetical protein
MSSTVIDAVVRAWTSQREYAAKLVADLSDADMVSQPVAGVIMNHTAWTLAHLASYHAPLIAMLKGEPFPDPLTSPYARGSRPSAETSAYPPKAAFMRDYLASHELVGKTLAGADPAMLDRPIPLERWKERFPKVGDAVVYLMLSHEATHLGQLSAWRRAGGRPAV